MTQIPANHPPKFEKRRALQPDPPRVRQQKRAVREFMKQRDALDPSMFHSWEERQVLKLVRYAIPGSAVYICDDHPDIRFATKAAAESHARGHEKPKPEVVPGSSPT
jgi:hypothetical protein